MNSIWCTILLPDLPAGLVRRAVCLAMCAFCHQDGNSAFAGRQKENSYYPVS